jgi:hypothetical protein
MDSSSSAGPSDMSAYCFICASRNQGLVATYRRLRARLAGSTPTDSVSVKQIMVVSRRGTVLNVPR